ncbi:3D domain-containing protein [Clostridium sp. SM-530-WT-3G]|uniref:3D domain-containing protein n=1 Tax=Clostridium sp. SM-530-WT-3G TaxID=2725303 RepID=UPI00197E9C69|nr:3D domain-containing protein [Clostridium sp. SM-530-WT-3G]
MKNFKQYLFEACAVLGICSTILVNRYVIVQAKTINENNANSIENTIVEEESAELVVLKEMNDISSDMVKTADLNVVTNDDSKEYIKNEEASESQEVQENTASESSKINGTPIKVELTAYCSDEECSGSWGNQTAMGTKVRKGVVAAPSNIKLGSKLYIPELEYYKSDGIFDVEDRGGAVKVKEDGTYVIDVWFPTHEETIEFGRKKTIVYLME